MDAVAIHPRWCVFTMRTLQTENRLWATWRTSQDRGFSAIHVYPIARPDRLAPFAQSPRPLLS
jgi:hypothetical protein